MNACFYVVDVQATEFQQELAEFIQTNGLNVGVMKVRRTCVCVNM